MMDKSSTPLISIIVPVYNVEKYLQRCIDSILAQSFKDFELILIDDGSKDKSGEICDAYAKRDARIRVFHKENGGVSTARNVGLDTVRGKWTCFVDSDDYVKPYYLHQMYERTQGWNNGRTFMVMTGMDSMIWRSTLSEQMVPLSDVPRFIADNHLPLSPFCKLFSTDVLQKFHIRFQQGITNGEDFVFVCDYLRHTDGISFFDSREYVYEIQPCSASKRCMPFEENLRNYRAMRRAWEALMERICIQKGEEALLLWRSGVQTRFYYLLTGLSHRPMPNIKRQMNLLYSIRKDISEFSNNADTIGIRSQIARFLLRKKKYLIYVLFNRLLTMIGKDAVA